MFRILVSGAACLAAAGLSLAQQPAAPPPPAAAPAPAATASAAQTPTAPTPAALTPAACPTPCPAYADVLTCNPCPCSGPCFWASAEVLGWWVQGQHLPPLLTTSPAGTPVGQAGVLGLPTTAVLVGDSSVNTGARVGGRFSAGYWIDPCERCGIGAEFFILDRATDNFAAASNGSPILARPFINTATGAQDAQIVAYPGVAAGGVTASASNQLLGAAAFVYKDLCRSCDSGVGVFAGYRYLRLEDDVTIFESVSPTTGANAGTVFLLSDHVNTLNQFHGGDVGMTFRYGLGRAYLWSMARLGIGATHREVTIDGQTVITPAGQTTGTVFPGGLYTTGPVRVEDTAFSLVPELRVNLGYRLTERLDVFVGYTALWWTNVARAGDQIDLRVNPAALPPATGPRTAPLSIKDTTIWVQGINLGLAYNY
jgi:hypothetical protein